jgi:hypothetical protein
MADLTLRSVKGSELTFGEIDRNFLSLDSDLQYVRHKIYFGNVEVEHAFNVHEHARIDAEIDSLNGKINSFDASLDASIDSISGQLNIFQGNIDSISGELNIFQGNIDSLNGKLNLININLDSSIDSLGNKLNLINNNLLSEISDVSDAQITYTGSLGVDVSGSSITSTVATSATRGSVKIGYGANGKNYPVQLSSEQMFVNVPWTDTQGTDTTYTAGSGLTLTGTTFSNTAPDQTVSITGGGATTVTGTYPNFTVSSTAGTSGPSYTAGDGLALSGTQFALDGTRTGSFVATGEMGCTTRIDIKGTTLDGSGNPHVFFKDANGVSRGLLYMSPQTAPGNTTTAVIVAAGNSSGTSIQNIIRGAHNGETDLYYAGQRKLSTTNAGAFVYGSFGSSSYSLSTDSVNDSGTFTPMISAVDLGRAFKRIRQSITSVSSFDSLQSNLDSGLNELATRFEGYSGMLDSTDSIGSYGIV